MAEALDLLNGLMRRKIMEKSTDSKRLYGEYEAKGEYHKDLDKKWRYYPVYVEKMKFIKRYLDKIPKNIKIIDLGCGEGVLVEEYKNEGWDIVGLDYNYSSKFVIKGDITDLKFKDQTFDLVLALDIIEHLSFDEQEKALSEISRILKRDGRVLISIPNLAHFASRITFLLSGKLLRTSMVDRHKGDRPIGEYIDLIKDNFEIINRKGFFPTFPVISLLTYLYPNKVLWMHKWWNRFLSYPNLCFLNILELKKK